MSAAFRWVGGKSHFVERMAPMIKAHLAQTGGRLISPFYGSGVVEQAVGGLQIAADSNADLRCFFEEARDDRGATDAVWWALQDIDHLSGRASARTDKQRKAIFRRVAAMGVGPQNRSLRAARFLWLQSFSFNGIWRENARGEYNGQPNAARLKRGLTCTQEDLKKLGDAIEGTAFHGDWTLAVAEARYGDLLFVDSPYLKTFGGYTAGGFREHAPLAEALKAAFGFGVAIVAFNSADGASLYPWASIETLKRSGRISSKGAGRRPVDELLITAGLKSAAERAV